MPGCVTRPEPSGRVALVTGANRGIGFEIARGLGELGMLVLLGARSAARGEDAAARLRGVGLAAQALEIDVTDDRSVAAAANEVSEGFGRIDVLVNNAAVAFDLGPNDTEVPIELVEQTFETNVLGVVRVVRTMLPLLELSDAPRIVNLSSRRGSFGEASRRAATGEREPTIYFASKAALNALTVGYARELGPRGFKVNAVSPGLCSTGMNDGRPGRSAAQGARIAIEMATIGDDGPNGSFVADEGPIDW